MHCIALNTMQFLQRDPSTEYIDIRCDDNDVIKSVMSACTFMIGGGGGAERGLPLEIVGDLYSRPLSIYQNSTFATRLRGTKLRKLTIQPLTINVFIP